MCAWGRQRKYYPAIVVGAKGIVADVKFDDGAEKRNVDLSSIYVES